MADVLLLERFLAAPMVGWDVALVLQCWYCNAPLVPDGAVAMESLRLVCSLSVSCGSYGVLPCWRGRGATVALLLWGCDAVWRWNRMVPTDGIRIDGASAMEWQWNGTAGMLCLWNASCVVFRFLTARGAVGMLWGCCGVATVAM